MEDQVVQDAQQAPASVGQRLRHAREAAGLSLADVAARTKIAERHLLAIEEERFHDLASRAYAVGFSRSYARSLGLDEGEVTQAVRDELADNPNMEPRHVPGGFEPGDPARVPGSRTAWLAAIGAVVAMAAVFFLWRSYYQPSIDLPDLAVATSEPADEAASAAPASDAAAPASTTPQGGQVVFTALQNGIWVKFYDASGAQLMQKQMVQGETYAVPAEANGPQIWTGRPDALSVTIGGRPVAPLADRQTTMKNVPVSAAALLARPPATSVPAAGPSAPVASTVAGQTSTVSN